MNEALLIDRLAEIGARLAILRADATAARNAAMQAQLVYVAATFKDFGAELEAIEKLIVEAARV